jgi:hypothetical protein
LTALGLEDTAPTDALGSGLEDDLPTGAVPSSTSGRTVHCRSTRLLVRHPLGSGSYRHFGDKDAIVLAAVEAHAVGLLADRQRGVYRRAATGRASRPRDLESAVETLLHSSRDQDARVQIWARKALLEDDG